MAGWRGRVARALLDAKRRGCKAFFALLDPDKPVDLDRVTPVLRRATAVLIGGSLGVTPYDVDELIAKLRGRGVEAPIIIFPGGINNVARSADAILYMSLLNSNDVHWVIGAQVAAAPIVARLGLEPLPTAYIILGEGGAAGHVGRVQPLPLDKPDIAAAYVLAAKFLGMRFIYLEAGSGARRHIPPEVVEASRRAAGQEPYIIVGGGIRTPDTARELTEAGADAIVVGTLIEKNPEKAIDIIEAIDSCRLS